VAVLVVAGAFSLLIRNEAPPAATAPTPTTVLDPEPPEIAIARAFFDARNAYDAESARALFSPDAQVQSGSLITSVDVYPALFDWLRATGWQWTIDECHMKSGDGNTSCAYHVENTWTRAMGLAPVQGAIDFEILGGSMNWVPAFEVDRTIFVDQTVFNQGVFDAPNPQLTEAWETVKAWIRANHPSDAEAMISDYGYGPVLDARSIDLWSMYTQEFVEDQAPKVITWRQSTLGFGGRTGFGYGGRADKITVACPPEGDAYGVFGTDTYTSDSSVCTAAVHAGLIGFEDGGVVVVQMGPAEASYVGSTANGVTSWRYGYWDGSFSFVDASGQPVVTEEPITTSGFADWNVPAWYLTDTGRYTVTCPPGGEASQVWGTGIYSGGSSVCTAAVHAGLIGFEDGGMVVIEIRPEEDSYIGSTANGVTSEGGGGNDGSFVFVDPTPRHFTWSDNLRRLNVDGLSWTEGEQFTIACHPIGELPTSDGYAVWGTDIYTDDSAVCIAAVHAGFIDFQVGGVVVIEMRSGRSQYLGTTANGVTTHSHGAWPWSFVFVD
jgi:hypothetical protein